MDIECVGCFYTGFRALYVDEYVDQFPPEEYIHHEAAFIDGTSTVNVLAGLPVSSLEMVNPFYLCEQGMSLTRLSTQLRHDAKVTLEALDYSSIQNDPFPDVFLKDQRDLPARFDVFVR
jgi:U3 small nucleolar RNA-associated protein 22